MLDVSSRARLIIKAIIKFSNPKSARKNTWHDNLIMAVSEQKSNLGLPESDVPRRRRRRTVGAPDKKSKTFPLRRRVQINIVNTGCRGGEALCVFLFCSGRLDLMGR